MKSLIGEVLNYLKIYQRLINKAYNRERIKERGYEIHHIVPRSVGGTNDIDNLVKLSYREHFIAHLLLTKIYPNSDALLYSAWKFSYSRDGHNKVLNSRTHAILKEKYIKSQRLFLPEHELRTFFKNPKNTILKAAVVFNCNWGTIKKNMVDYNIEYLWDGTYTDRLTKEEIISILNEYNLYSLHEISDITGIKYWVLNEAVKNHSIEHLRPSRFVENERRLLSYINSGANHIDRHKLFKEFNMSARKVTSILAKNGIVYASKREVDYSERLSKLYIFLKDMFKEIPDGYSAAGFSKHFEEDWRTILKYLTECNIKYNFSYRHHKGSEYEHSVLPFIKRGIGEGILKK